MSRTFSADLKAYFYIYLLNKINEKNMNEYMMCVFRIST